MLSIDETIAAVESAFKMKATGRTQMPPKQYVFLKKYNGDLRTMPAYIENVDVATVKVVNSHPNNREQGLPTVMATITLVDPKTGFPKAIMSGTWITALRTAAAGAIAANYLANPNPKTVGFVGAGTQARTQLMGLQKVFDSIRKVKVWDINEKASETYVEEMERTYPQLEFCSAKTVKEAVQNVDVVVTATPSRKPLVFAEWINKGTHINCIGADAPGKQELDPAILLKSKIIIDDWEQGVHGGEINVPFAKGLISKEDIWGDICEVVAGLKAGRTSEEEITVFSSTGLAIQDTAAANIAYSKALQEKIGKQVDILNV